MISISEFIAHFNTRMLGLSIALLLTFGCGATAVVQSAPPRDLLADLATANYTGLIAGVATVDITPDHQVYIAGFRQARTSVGVHDPISARAVYLANAESSVVILVADLVGFLYQDVEEVRRMVSRAHPERIIITTTHNHEGPDPIGFWGCGIFLPLTSGRDENYIDEVKRRMVWAINTAILRARPARLSLANARAPEGYCSNLWVPGKWERDILVMQIDGTDGAPITTLVNFACHAEMMFLGHNRKISADWPGMLRPKLERELGGTALLLQGALGGMITVDLPLSARPKQRIPFTEEFTDRMTANIVDQLKHNAETIEPGAVGLQYRRKKLTLDVENDTFLLAAHLGVFGRGAIDPDNPIYETEVGVLDIGPARFALVPGELLPGLSKELKGAMSSNYRGILGLANDEIAYLLNERQYHDPIYGYERSMSMSEGAGRIVVDAIKSLY
jgi:hypothetical protein